MLMGLWRWEGSAADFSGFLKLIGVGSARGFCLVVVGGGGSRGLGQYGYIHLQEGKWGQLATNGDID